MIGGLLRLAPGRLGARQEHALCCCGSHEWAASYLLPNAAAQ